MTTAAGQLRTTAEVAEYLRVPVATLHQWRYHHGGPPAAKVGRHLRYRRSDLEAWLEAKTTSVA